MDGRDELATLAHLLRVGAGTGRQIATLREADRETINRLAGQADRMAAEIDALLGQDRLGQDRWTMRPPRAH